MSEETAGSEERLPSAAMPRVVAVVINYNYGRFLGDCLASIDAQDYDGLRAIVVDDCSTDNSRQVIEAWSASTAVEHEVIFKPENRGPAHSYNLAIAMLEPTDDFVVFLDADDYWLPGRVCAHVDAFATLGPEMVVVYSEVADLDDATGVMRDRAPCVVEGDVMPHLLTVGAGFLPLTAAAIRRPALRHVRVPESRRLCDYGLWLQVARHGRFAFHPGVVAVIRRHGSSMTATESLTADRLEWLADAATNRRLRRLARMRGRKLAHAAMAATSPVSSRAAWRYAVRARDVPSGLWFFIAQLAPARRLVRRIVSQRPHR